MSDSNPTPAPPPVSGKKFGLPLWLLIVLLFGVAGVVAWQTGTLDPLIAKLSKPAKPTGPVNVNTASLEELRALPGVDEKLAAEMIKERPFETVDDVKKVKGIGDKKLEKLRPLITVQ
jgi:competence protein ComEA